MGIYTVELVIGQPDSPPSPTHHGRVEFSTHQRHIIASSVKLSCGVEISSHSAKLDLDDITAIGRSLSYTANQSGRINWLLAFVCGDSGGGTNHHGVGEGWGGIGGVLGA